MTTTASPAARQLRQPTRNTPVARPDARQQAEQRPGTTRSDESKFEQARPPLVALTPPVAPADATAAVAKARGLLSQGAASGSTIDNATITNNAPDANDAGDLSGPRAREALGQVLENAPLESAALAALSPEAAAEYQTVKSALLAPSDAAPNGDPVAALALQTMLLEGSLPGKKAAGGDQTLLGTLETLATQPLGEGIDRQQLLGDVVQEVATPASIAQKELGTCMPTSIQIQLAQNNPAEYARLVSGLASPAGTVTTVGGDTLAVEPGALADASGRTVSQRLLAPALMELGNGRASYDNTLDLSLDAASMQPGSKGQVGLTPAQGDVVLESLYGRDFAFNTPGNDAERAVAAEYIVGQLAQGESVVTGLKWTSGGHAVLATGTETRDGQQYVTIVNPWGREESIRLDEFQARLLCVNYDPN